jgi:hypothetical protein
VPDDVIIESIRLHAPDAVVISSVTGTATLTARAWSANCGPTRNRLPHEGRGRDGHRRPALPAGYNGPSERRPEIPDAEPSRTIVTAAAWKDQTCPTGVVRNLRKTGQAITPLERV